MTTKRRKPVTLLGDFRRKLESIVAQTGKKLTADLTETGNLELKEACLAFNRFLYCLAHY